MTISTTTNYGLKKVDDATTIPDAFDAENDNMDTIDSALNSLQQSVSFINGVARLQCTIYGGEHDGISLALISSSGKKYVIDANNAQLYYIIENADGTRQSRRSVTWTGQ